jgi:hypothetical protein
MPIRMNIYCLIRILLKMGTCKNLLSKLRLNIEFNKDSDFIKNNFDVFTSANIKNSVAAGYPVIVKFSNSYITVLVFNMMVM